MSLKGGAIASLVVAATVVAAPRAQDTPPADRTQRLEGEAILALADAALAGKRTPVDFQVLWQNEFLKAQRGTFIPFTLTIDASRLSRPAVLVYVRAVLQPGQRDRSAAGRARLPEPAQPGSPDEFPVDAIFPADLKAGPGERSRVSRGFTLAPGLYDVYVVVRERAEREGRIQPRAAVLKQPLEVPDFSAARLTTSSVILADRLETLSRPLDPEELPERPYVIGQNEITPAADRRFRKNEELLVVVLIYYPFVTSERKFDLQVEYHFFRRGVGAGGHPPPGRPSGSHPPPQEGERYFNHTDPQRFNPATLGGSYDPTSGQPVLAGQGVPLGGFEEGDYRLAIWIRDLLAGASIVRDVHFTVGS